MRHRRCVSVLAAALLGGLAMVTWDATMAPAQPKAASKILKALVLREAVDATSPEALVWKRAPAIRVPLQPAFPGHLSIVGTPSTIGLTAQAVRTPDQLYVRLAWDDATADLTVDGTGRFVDAAAVQFPLNGKPTTTPFMGDATNPVNVWYWRANGQPETLIAAGFGSLTPAPVQEVRALGVRTDRGWQVVIARRLTPASDDGVRLSGVRQIPVAFAVWNGSNEERDGFKAVTLEWWVLRF